MTVDRPLRSLRCRIGFHWWSVLSCDNVVPGPEMQPWSRHCLLCGRVEQYRETFINELDLHRRLGDALPRVRGQQTAPQAPLPQPPPPSHE